MSQPAARVGDMHVCPMVTPGTPPVPHVGGPILPPGGVTVLIGNLPAARMGNMCTCVGPPDVIAQGAVNVLICGQPAARMGDMTSHGGSIAIGCPTVLIGMSPGGGSTGANAAPASAGAAAEADENCFQCRQRLADEGAKSSDPQVKQAAADMDRLNHDFEHAKLAEHVYEDNKPAPDGWTALDPSNSEDRQKLEKMGIEPGDLSQNDSNYRARVYVPDPEHFGDSMKPTVVFKGTTMTSGEDWKNNLQQSVGLESDYYRNAVRIGKNTRAHDADVEFTGHSLGAGLASAASQASGKDATTFNSAGLNSGTVKKYGGDPHSSNVNAYRVENEVLTGIQEQGWKGTLAAAGAGFKMGGIKGAILGAVGKVAVSAVAPDAIGNKYEVSGTGNPVTRHGMGVAKDGVEEKIQATETFLEDELGIECDC